MFQFKVKCKSYVCDINNYEELKSIINKQSKVDILINNAGTNFPEHFTKVKKENMEYMVRLNNIATFNLAQLCVLKMLKTKTQRFRTGKKKASGCFSRMLTYA